MLNKILILLFFIFSSSNAYAEDLIQIFQMLLKIIQN